jgi:hypothetical protein
MTPDLEKEKLETLKSIASSLDMLVRHAQLAFIKLDWPTVSPPTAPKLHRPHR